MHQSAIYTGMTHLHVHYTCKYMKQVIRLKGVGTQRGHECVQYHKEIRSKTMAVHSTQVYIYTGW